MFAESVCELNLRHLHGHKLHGLLEQELHEHRDVRDRRRRLSLAGGELLWRGPPGVPCARQPPLEPPWPGTLAQHVAGSVPAGTSITCSAKPLSKIFRTSTNWSTICGTGASSSGTTGTQSVSCSTVCRRTLSCGPDTASSLSGRELLAAGGSSSSRKKCCTPAAWGCGESSSLGSKFSSRSPGPGPVGRYGANTRPRPQRRKDVHVATTVRVVARAASWPPPQRVLPSQQLPT